MIDLVPINDAQFQDYRRYFIEDYAQDLIKNHGLDKNMALGKARKSLDQSFPNGAQSLEHSLLCIQSQLDNSKNLLGYIWHRVDTKEHSSYIYDFYVLEACRGQGIGRSAIKILEKQLLELGVVRLNLRVAYNNQRAFELYQELGFEITGYNMSKTILNS